MMRDEEYDSIQHLTHTSPEEGKQCNGSPDVSKMTLESIEAGLIGPQNSGSSTPCQPSPKEKHESYTPAKMPCHLDFFENVSRTGYPTGDTQATQARPWKDHWKGPQQPTDGRLLIAVPSCSDYGTSYFPTRFYVPI